MTTLSPNAAPDMGARRFGRVNWRGLATLTGREIRRFTKVYGQTILAPMATAALFLAVFTLALAERRGEVMGAPFTHFLAPGVLMMTVIQNAFANSSSSILIAKVQGNIVDTLMPPLSAGELLVGYVAGGAARGLLVALFVGIMVFTVLGFAPAAPLWLPVFAVLGAVIMSLIGVFAGTLCQKFDQMAAITNFIITPLSFLSGTFYSVGSLPGELSWIGLVNPVFYLIDGFRFGAIGVSDASPWLSLAVSLGVAAALWLLALRLFRSGRGLKV